MGEYQDLYLKRNALLLTDVFENFKMIYLKIHEADPAKSLSASELSWPAALKVTKVKLELLTDICILLMVEKGIREGICHSINRYAKANHKYIKDYDKNKESSYLKYWDVNNLFGWALSKKLLLNGFKWIENLSEFNKDFIRSCDKKIKKNIFLNLTFSIPKN